MQGKYYTMGLAKDLLEFFHEDRLPQGAGKLPSFSEFLDAYPQYRPATYVNAVVNKLELESFLLLVDTSWQFGARDRRFQTLAYKKADGIYGSYDYSIFGFKLVREDFVKSVRPIIALDKKEEYIGTGFVAEHGGKSYFVTARHCIENLEHITIYNEKDVSLIPHKIYVPKIPDYQDEYNEFTKADIAILTFDETHFQDTKRFRFESGEILDSILVMGYPPMGVFDKAKEVNNAIQLAETVSIASKYFLKSSSGQAVGKGHIGSLNHDYLLINARVKGGSSGSPVINNKGKVIGMITQIPSSGGGTNDGANDLMGFGFAIPQEMIVKIIDSINGSPNGVAVSELKFKSDERGFSTK